MRRFRRLDDGTFEVDFAPFLGIIISIVPMLLLSLVFMHIQFIETPIPQIVAEHMANQDESKDPITTVSLRVDKENGFVFLVTEPRGKPQEVKVGLKEGQLDYEALVSSAHNLKTKYTDVFRLDFAPSSTVSFDEIVQTMDSVRRMPASLPKVAFIDSKSGEQYETDLMFPDVVFSNVIGEM